MSYVFHHCGVNNNNTCIIPLIFIITGTLCFKPSFQILWRFKQNSVKKQETNGHKNENN